MRRILAGTGALPPVPGRGADVPRRMEVGREEIEALTRVIERRILPLLRRRRRTERSRFLEREFAEPMGSKHALCVTRLGGADLP